MFQAIIQTVLAVAQGLGDLGVEKQSQTPYYQVTSVSNMSWCENDFDLNGIDQNEIVPYVDEFNKLKSEWELIQKQKKEFKEDHNNLLHQLERFIEESERQDQKIQSLKSNLSHKKSELNKLKNQWNSHAGYEQLTNLDNMLKVEEQLIQYLDQLHYQNIEISKNVDEKFDVAQNYYQNVVVDLWEQLNSVDSTNYNEINQQFEAEYATYNRYKNEAYALHKKHLKDVDIHTEQLKIYNQIIGMDIYIDEYDLEVAENQQLYTTNAITWLNMAIQEDVSYLHQLNLQCEETKNLIVEIMIREF